MYAELFPVAKIPCNYGKRSYELRGKDFDELQANIPKYNQKVMDTQADLAKTIPTTYDEAAEDYRKFKEMLFARDNQEGFTESIEEGFIDRMKLLQYYKIIGDKVKTAYRIIGVEEPIDWLDRSHLVYYNFIDRGIYMNYVQPGHTRPSKIISKTDYCAELVTSLSNDNGWASGTAKNAHHLVFRCYDIFPYNDAAAKKIFDLSLLMLEFYVFSNFTSNGIGSGVVYRKLKEQELQFDSSLHFHEYFKYMLSRLNDAHISYKVDCYEQFTFVQPVYIQHLNDDNHGFGIYITKANTPELQDWVGARVTAIDGIDADSKVYKFGNQLGKSHNGYTRYTLGLSRLFFDSSSQDFRLDRGLYLKRTTIPERSYLVYTLRKQDSTEDIEIKVDWLIFKNPTLIQFDDQYSYWNRNCQAKPFTRTSKVSTTTLQKRDSGQLKPYRNNIKRRSRLQKRTSTYRATIDGTIPVALGPGFAFFILNDPRLGDYGVLVIQTFDAPDIDNWFQNMRLGFLTLIDKGITRLLLDLTGNSGGMLCLAYSLLGVLSPSPSFPFPATEFTYGTRAVPTDDLLRISACVDEAKIKTSPFKLQCFKSLDTRADFPDGYNWGSEGEIKPKVVNGLISGYTKFSPFLMDKCVMKSTPLLADVKPKFTTIILVSDGLCGSSCAIVVTYLQQHNSPAIVLSPKDENAPIPSLYSFAGGQVVNINNIKDVAKRSSCFDMIPDTLETAQMTITYRGIFNTSDKKNPLEYYIMPGQFRFDYTMDYANSYSARWVDFFQRGMNIFQNPDDYVLDISESGKVIPFTM